MIATPSVLVLNGSHAEIPLIKAAQRLGFRVITTGASPSGLGHAYADQYIPADFADARSVEAIARRHEVVGVVSACNDFAAVTASRVGADLCLSGHDDPETTRIIHHKDQLRDLMSSLGLRSILSTRASRQTRIEHVIDVLELPVIVKPVDLTGGKGMRICESPESVVEAISYALDQSRQSHVLVEQYLTGSHHGFTCFVQSGRVVWWFADDEQYFINPFLVAGTSTPSSLDADAIDDLVTSVEAIAIALAIVDGLVHVQCILTSDGPAILEICRRCPGDLYPEFVQLSTGYDYSANIVRSEIGMPLELPSLEGHASPTARHCAMSRANGVFRGVAIAPSLRSRVTDEWRLVEPGSRIDDFLTQKQRIVLMQFSTRKELDEHLTIRDSTIEVLVEEG